MNSWHSHNRPISRVRNRSLRQERDAPRRSPARLQPRAQVRLDDRPGHSQLVSSALLSPDAVTVLFYVDFINIVNFMVPIILIVMVIIIIIIIFGIIIIVNIIFVYLRKRLY